MRERSSGKRFAAGGIVLLALAVLGFWGYQHMRHAVKAPSTESGAQSASELVSIASTSETTVEAGSAPGEDAEPPALGSVSGQVIYVVTGRPVAGTTVGLAVLRPTHNKNFARVLAEGPAGPILVSTDAEGRFVVPNVPPGRCWLTIQDAAFAPAEKEPELTLGPGEHCRDQALHVTDGGGATGRVYDYKSMRGVPGIIVESLDIHLGDWHEDVYRVARTDSRGVYALTSLPHGDYCVGGKVFARPWPSA